ncbi:MAG: hypothetical protein ACHQX1_02230 [Candidatus Micrarchaeales archaeon]
MTAKGARKRAGGEAEFRELLSMPSSKFGGILNTDFRIDVAVRVSKEWGRSFDFRFYDGMGYNSRPGAEDKAGIIWVPHMAFIVRMEGKTAEDKPIYEAALYEHAPGESEFLADKGAKYGILLENYSLGSLPILALALRTYRSNMIKKLTEEQHIMEHAKTVLFLGRANILCELVEAYMADVFEAPLKKFARRHESKDTVR